MKKMNLVLGLSCLAISGLTFSQNQSLASTGKSKGDPHAKTEAGTVTGGSESTITRTGRDLGRINEETMRTDIVDRVGKATNGKANPTSGHREPDDMRASIQHDKGANDFVVGNNSKKIGQAISKSIGKDSTVIVEKVNPPSRTDGARTDTHTAFRNGIEGRTRVVPNRASKNHIHVQPNNDTRIKVSPETYPTHIDRSMR